jgi:hypothetical protein
MKNFTKNNVTVDNEDVNTGKVVAMSHQHALEKNESYILE